MLFSATCRLQIYTAGKPLAALQAFTAVRLSWRKMSWAALSWVSRALSLAIVSPAAEKSLSAGAEVAWIARHFLASSANRGKRFSLFLHQMSGSENSCPPATILGKTGSLCQSRLLEMSTKLASSFHRLIWFWNITESDPSGQLKLVVYTSRKLGIVAHSCRPLFTYAHHLVHRGFCVHGPAEYILPIKLERCQPLLNVSYMTLSSWSTILGEAPEYNLFQ